ncbi:MAG: hypothetical protein R3F61_12555 [Myxococcota bacterium]
MDCTLTGFVPYTAGECVVWSDGRDLARGPVLQEHFTITVPDAPGRVVVEHRVDGDVRRARVVDLNEPRVEVSAMTRGSTLRAQAWRQSWERGLGDRLALIDSLLPDPVGEAVRSMSQSLRNQARSQLLRALRVAMHTQRFAWEWDQLDPALKAQLSAPVRTLIVVGVWRSALRVSEVDRPLIELCEPAAARLEQRACGLATRILNDALAPHGVVVPDPRERPLSAWPVAVLFALRATTEVDVMVLASLCSEVAVAIDRVLDGVVATALERDDPEVLRTTLAGQLAALERSLQADLAEAAPRIPGGWIAIVALWVSSLSGLGFNEDIDRSTESYTVPST